MTAKEIYEKLHLSCNRQEKKIIPCKNGMAIIRKRGAKLEDGYYVIYLTGRVFLPTKYEFINVEQIPDDDYEFYSPVQIIKSGYIEFPDVTNKIQLREKLSDLLLNLEGHKCPINGFWKYSTKLNRDLIVGGCQFLMNGLEVELYTRGELIDEKGRYRAMGLQTLSYGTMLNSKNFTVGIRLISNTDHDTQIREVSNQLETIREIMGYLPEGAIFHDNYIKQWEPELL